MPPSTLRLTWIGLLAWHESDWIGSTMLMGDSRGSLNKNRHRAWSRVFQADQALLGSRDAFGSEQKTAFFVLLVSKMAN
jgi:hypothetical protein